MRNQFETPLEIRQFRAQQWRVHRWRMWARTSLLALLPALGLFGWFWWLDAMPLAELAATFLLTPIVLPGVFYLSAPFLALRTRDRWQWDEAGLVIRGRRYRWRAFQDCLIERDCLYDPAERPMRLRMVKPESPPAPLKKATGYAIFTVRFRDRFYGSGMAFMTNAYTDDVARLAAFATPRINLR